MDHKILTPSTYGRTWSQKKPQSSTTLPINLSSSIPASLPFRVSMPEPMSSDVSASRVAMALGGELETMLCICRLTRVFKSSLSHAFCMSQGQDGGNCKNTHIGIRRGSPLNNGRTRTCRVPHGLSPEVMTVMLGA